jgi:hypothetical protein
VVGVQIPEELHPDEHPPSTPAQARTWDDTSSSYDLSSNSVFVRDVTSAAVGLGGVGPIGSAEQVRANQERPALLATSTPVSVPRDSGIDIRNMVLPPRNLADRLLCYFWESLYPLAPILHRPTFDAQYENLWRPSEITYSKPAQDTTNVVFHAILNMIMAIGCLDDENYDPARKEDYGGEFYQRSQKLVSMETIDRFSLPIVQLLILRAFYLLRTSFAERCWTATGVAIGAAQGLGLDTPTFHSGSSDQRTREMRLRVWYSCVTLDR